MNLKIQIVEVDMQSLNGRNRHPKKSDEGKVGLVLKMWFEVGAHTSLNDDVESLEAVAVGIHKGEALQMYTVLLNDGRIVEVSSYEVEVI